MANCEIGKSENKRNKPEMIQLMEDNRDILYKIQNLAGRIRDTINPAPCQTTADPGSNVPPSVMQRLVEDRNILIDIHADISAIYELIVE